MPVYSYKTRSGKKWLFKASISGKQILRRGYQTRLDAVRAEAVFLSTHDDKVTIPDFETLVDAFIMHQKQVLKITTYYSMVKYVEKHIKGHFPNKKIDKLSYGDFENWRSYMSKLDLVNKNKYLSFLRQIFDFCDTFYNYRCRFAYLIVPFKDRKIEKPADSEKYVTYEDFLKFLKVVESDMLRLLFILTYFTGLRLGEVLGLQKESYRDGYIYIYQSLTNKVGKGKSVLVQPKTAKSNRKYLLPGFLDRLIRSYIVKEKLKQKDFMFPISRTSLSRKMKSYCFSSGIKPFHIHQLRSTDSTMLHEMGFKPDDIASYLGHDSDKTTKKYYIELTESRKKEISQALEERFSKDFS